MKNIKFRIDASESKIYWKGRNTAIEHNGTVAIKEGYLTFNDGILAGGEVVIDTTSIKVLDIADPVTNKQFVGHLLSDDFFASEQNPEALFVITQAEKTGLMNHNVKGDLTVKGITKAITFHPKVFISGNIVKACGIIIVNRTHYGMKFRSGNFFKNLQNRFISDEFELEVSITAKEVSEPVFATFSLN